MIPSPDTILDWALYYHGLGLSLIPVDPRTKRPTIKSWKVYQTERASENQVREWFQLGRNQALAIVTGAVSGGLAVLDFDSVKAYAWFAATHPDLIETLPIEETARPGYHALLTCPPTRTQRPGKQVELLSEGAYAIVSPSPGKTWVREPVNPIPCVDPFALGLERFGITKEGQLTEESEEREEMASVSSVSSLSSVNQAQTGENTQLEIERVITETQPTETGQRNYAIFALCRHLKSIAEIRDRPIKDLRPIVETWHARAYETIGTKDFEATWKDFVYGWKRVKWPKGAQIDMVMQRAIQDDRNPLEAMRYQDPRNQLLVRLCWQLQRVNGTQPFYLSLRTAGDLLGLSHTEASKRLEMLEADGFIAIAEAHTNIRATRYQYILPRE